MDELAAQRKLMKNFITCLDHLWVEAERSNGRLNLHSALGEIGFNGVRYQIQLSFVSDQRAWCEKNEVLGSDITKVYD